MPTFPGTGGGCSSRQLCGPTRESPLRAPGNAVMWTFNAPGNAVMWTFNPNELAEQTLIRDFNRNNTIVTKKYIL
jgi:hypothetical protein